MSVISNTTKKMILVKRRKNIYVIELSDVESNLDSVSLKALLESKIDKMDELRILETNFEMKQ